MAQDTQCDKPAQNSVYSTTHRSDATILIVTGLASWTYLSDLIQNH